MLGEKALVEWLEGGLSLLWFSSNVRTESKKLNLFVYSKKNFFLIFPYNFKFTSLANILKFQHKFLNSFFLDCKIHGKNIFTCEQILMCTKITNPFTQPGTDKWKEPCLGAIFTCTNQF